MKQLPNNYPFQMYFQQACALMCVIYTLYLDRLFEYSLFQGLIQNWIQDRAITWGFILPLAKLHKESYYLPKTVATCAKGRELVSQI